MRAILGNRAVGVRAAAIAIVSAAGLGLAACSTATPVTLSSSRIPDIPGRVNTTGGYTGQITTENGSCRGSFTGYPGQGVVPLEVSCQDGRRGIGTATLAEGYFQSAEARLSDGSRLTIMPRGPGYP